jgi:hypothetical protein
LPLLRRGQEQYNLSFYGSNETERARKDSIYNRRKILLLFIARGGMLCE